MHSLTHHFNHFNPNPFGMMIEGRSWQAGGAYRYGFNGMERDDQVKGKGNSLDFGARVYDSRLGRFYSVDLFESEYSFLSPYAFCKNQPTLLIDIEGNKFVNPYTNRKIKHEEQLQKATNVFEEFMAMNTHLNKEPTMIRRLFNKGYREKHRLTNEVIKAESDYDIACQKEILVMNMLYTLEEVDNSLYSRMEDLDQSIPIFLEDALRESRSSGAVGMTKVITHLDNTGEVSLGPVQKVSLYRGQGLETLANELGDIEYVLDFVKSEEQHTFYQNDTRPYFERPETKYSFGVQERVSKAYKEYKKDNNIKSEELDQRGSLKKDQKE